MGVYKSNSISPGSTSSNSKNSSQPHTQLKESVATN